MIIHDAHTHIFPHKIAEKATVSIGSFYGFDEMFSVASTENLLKCGSKINTKLKLVCSSAVTKEQVSGINSFIADECKKNSDFLGFAALHPDTENFQEVLDFAITNNLRGIKFHPDFQKFNIDDKKVYPMYRLIAEYKLPVLFHMGDNRYDFSSPLRLKKVMYDIPDLKIMAAHFGGYQRWDEALTLEKSENLYFDTSSALSFMERETVFKFFDKFGYDKFLFGTDFPMWNPETEVNNILSLNLGEENNQLIFHKNFENLFDIG